MDVDSAVVGSLEEWAYKIRKLAIEMITWAEWGHIGGSMSMADILSSLYFDHMRVRPDQPSWDGRDRLVLSKAHGSPALYSALALRGYFPVERVFTYCQLGGLEGHTDMGDTPGVEASGGPLGQGLSVALGRALALRYKGNTVSRVFCIVGDGECNEGQIWEAAMAAANFCMDNLIAIIDYNKMMAKGPVWQLMGIEPLADKWRSFGWEVIEVDGHNIKELLGGFHLARYVRRHGKPICIIAHTVKGQGIDMAEFNPEWHTHAPNPQIADEMIRNLAQNYHRPQVGYSRGGTVSSPGGGVR